MKPVPKQIHIIWLGSALPERSQVCVQTFTQMNPDWWVNLWIDSAQLLTGQRVDITKGYYESKHGPGSFNVRKKQKLAHLLGDTATDDDTKRYLKDRFGFNSSVADLKKAMALSFMEKFCSRHYITLRDISEITGLNNNPLYQREMVRRGTNFGAASDILRVEILYRFGGVYFDTDVLCLEPLGSILAEQSHPRWAAVHNKWRNGRITREEWFGDEFWRQSGHMWPPGLSNSIIASHPKCQGLDKYRAMIKENYRQVDSGRLDFKYYDDMKNATIEMTGPAAVTRVTGFNKRYKETEGQANKIENKKGKEAALEFQFQECLYLRDHWYFPMYLISDQYFGSWWK